MTIDVRACTSVEDLANTAVIGHWFGSSGADVEWAERFSKILPVERMHGAWEDGAGVGGAGAFPFTLTVPGGEAACAGVTVVGVSPTHRRRGILRQLMRAQLDDVHERGEPLALLWASEATIYGRFGYGMASLQGELELPRERTAYARPFEQRGQARLVTHDEALELLPPVYEDVRRETPGMYARPREWWEHRRLFDGPNRPAGAGALNRVVLELDGRPAAYALYRMYIEWQGSSTNSRLDVLEALGTTPEATAAIWRYLLDVDWIARVTAGRMPVDHPLFLLLAEARRMEFRVGDGVWCRLVDVEAALAARSYREGEPVVLEIRDAFCPWNDGRYRVGGGVSRVDSEPDLRLDVDALGSVYLGGFTFRQLADAFRVEEVREGALDRADALFRTHRAPWCPEIF